MSRQHETRKTLTLTSLRSERQGAVATRDVTTLPIPPEIEILLDEIGQWVNEGGAGGEVRRL